MILVFEVIKITTTDLDLQLPVQRVEGVPEEEGDEAVCPRVGAEDVEDAEAGTAEPDGGEELELEAGRRRDRIGD